MVKAFFYFFFEAAVGGVVVFFVFEFGGEVGFAFDEGVWVVVGVLVVFSVV